MYQERELDHRGLGHVTACVTINDVKQESMIYLARGFVFNGRSYMQGLGTDAQKYTAVMEEQRGRKVLVLEYDGIRDDFPVIEDSYVPAAPAHH